MFSYHTYCGLIILIELAGVYHQQGYLLEDIAHKHGIPTEALTQALQRLTSIGLIEIRGNGSEWLFLHEDPKTIYIYDIIKLFDNSFSGHFHDSKNGFFTKDSQLKLFLREEQQTYERIIKNRIGRLSIETYVQRLKQKEKTIKLKLL